uniref:(northern house mosquito) hypothetical protein n=1 Tax=Culex pipiens TaxID=7175 RepID=A0A8D8G7I5_CULPI
MFPRRDRQRSAPRNRLWSVSRIIPSCIRSTRRNARHDQQYFQNHRIPLTNTPAIESDLLQIITIPFKIPRFGRSPAARQRKLPPLERSASRIQATKAPTRTSTTAMFELQHPREVVKWRTERQPIRTTEAITPSSRLGLRRKSLDFSRVITRLFRTWRPRHTTSTRTTRTSAVRWYRRPTLW